MVLHQQRLLDLTQLHHMERLHRIQLMLHLQASTILHLKATSIQVLLELILPHHLKDTNKEFHLARVINHHPKDIHRVTPEDLNLKQ